MNNLNFNGTQFNSVLQSLIAYIYTHEIKPTTLFIKETKNSISFTKESKPTTSFTHEVKVKTADNVT